jgi:hypothetical protein
MSKQCLVCGAPLEPGTVRARNKNTLADEDFGVVVSEFSFVRPGTPTSANPISAFQQGMRGEPAEQLIPMSAFRCTRCGRVELYALE